MTTYPNAPGFKALDTETSALAASQIGADAETIREQVRRILHRYDGCTADEAADFLGLSILAVRPRFSELKAAGELEDSGERRRNSSGKLAVVWREAMHRIQPELL